MKRNTQITGSCRTAPCVQSQPTGGIEIAMVSFIAGRVSVKLQTKWEPTGKSQLTGLPTQFSHITFELQEHAREHSLFTWDI